MAETLTEYINSQDELIQEAALALPHQFSHCTYPLGPLRQAVYLCLTCSEARGLCSACSIACHTDHQQLELFPKRHFRCDCPTSSLSHKCTLHTTLEDENKANAYGQNFRGLFCRCGRPYDPKKERETMIQCLSCEDWFHESCCNLRERPSSRGSSPEVLEGPESAQDAINDAQSETSSSGLPPPLISGLDYEAFICKACIQNIPILLPYIGTQGTLMVTRNKPSDPWKRFPDTDADPFVAPVNVVDDSDALNLNVGSKRRRSLSSADAPDAKRPRGLATDPTPVVPCSAPLPNPLIQSILVDPSLATGDLFLLENFRERLCKCPQCLPSLQVHPYLLEDEETYEPPEDPDSGLSLEELGMRALERIPRDRAIDGIHAFNALRDDLMKYLRPFAQEGKIVNESDVRDFFASLSETARQSKQ